VRFTKRKVSEVATPDEAGLYKAEKALKSDESRWRPRPRTFTLHLWLLGERSGLRWRMLGRSLLGLNGEPDEFSHLAVDPFGRASARRAGFRG